MGMKQALWLCCVVPDFPTQAFLLDGCGVQKFIWNRLLSDQLFIQIRYPPGHMVLGLNVSHQGRIPPITHKL